MWPFSRKPVPAPPVALQTPTETLALLPPPALPKRAPRRGVVAAATQPSSEWTIAHPGRGLTPSTIRQAMDAAEVGHPQMQCDVFDDLLERDASLRSLVDSRIMS